MIIIILALSLIYSIILNLIISIIRKDRLYNESLKTINQSKTYIKTKMISVGQYKKLMNSYRIYIIKELEILGVSLLLFIIFIYNVLPLFVANSYIKLFVIFSIIFSTLINLLLYLFKKHRKNVDTEVKEVSENANGQEVHS